MHVGPPEYGVAFAAVLVGGLVQGSIGFGLNLLAAPFVALVVPEALPVTLVLVAFPAAVATAVREHAWIDRHALAWMLSAAVPGTLIGLVIVGALDAAQLAVVVGTVTLLGVVLSVVSPPLTVTPATSALAGLASNITGTAAAVGGPPVALLFQHHEGRVVRPTLGAFFSASASLSLLGYVIAGEIDGDQLLFALSLAPAMIIGFVTSRHLHGHVDSGWLRPAVLTLSAVAGIAAVVRGIT